MRSIARWSWLGAIFAIILTPAMEAQVGSPAGPVPVDLLLARRQAIMAAMGTGVAVLGSAEVRSIEANGPHPQDEIRS